MGFKEAVAAAIAGKQLDALVSSARRVLDQVIEGTKAVPGIRRSYDETKRVLDELARRFGPPVFPTGQPNLKVLPAYTNFLVAKKAVEYLAKLVSNLVAFSRVYTGIEEVLRREGLSTDADTLAMVVRQIARFIMDTDTKFAGVPEYSAAKAKILSRAEADRRTRGVSDPADPGWIEAQISAAEAEFPGSGLSGAPVALIPLLISLAKTVAVVVGVVLVASRVAAAAGGKSKQIFELYMNAEEEKKITAQRLRAEGKSEAEVQAALAAIDKSVAEKAEEIQKASTGVEAFTKGAIGTVLAIAGIAIGTKAVGLW